MDIFVRKINEVDMRVECDADIAVEVADYFSFFVPGYKFMPKFRSGFWDGKIKLLSLDDRILKIGLLTHLLEFAKNWNYSITIDEKLYPKKFDKAEFDKYFDELVLTNEKDERIYLHGYQLQALEESIKLGRRTIVSPTASGKSLIIYCLIRWYEDHGDANSLVIVPTIALVYQMARDFEDYSRQNGWNYQQIQQVAEGKKPKPGSVGVTVSTWQSLANLPRTWFWGFQTVIGDEAHQYKAQEIGKICGNCVNAGNRFGLTGTLTSDGSKANKLIIQGLFGRSVRVASTKELMDKGHIAGLEIDIIQTTYSDADREYAAPLDYAEEVKFVEKHKGRSNLIAGLAMKCEKNVLVLFRKIDHGKDLLDRINALNVDDTKKVFFIDGSISGEDRVTIQLLMEKEHNIILVASYGTFSTGVNVKNIHYIIFASPSKSAIRVCQSIGRGLRKLAGKESVKLYDIADMIYKTSKKTKTPKYCMLHANERVKIYAKEDFNFRFVPIAVSK